MAVNTLGYVPVYDFGAPRIISGRARETISGGEFVFASGATNVVGSGANSFNPVTDLLFATDASGGQFTGVAMHNAGSNEPVSVAIDGVIISVASATILAGQHVACDGANALLVAGSVAGTVPHQRVIGRALTSAGSEGHCLWHIQG